MQFTHLRTNHQNDSEFSIIEIPLERSGVEMTANLHSPSAMIINQTDTGHNYSWHNAPQRQWVVTLQGEIEVKLRNGETKRFTPGSVLLADDLKGTGHSTSIISKEPWQCIYLPFSGALPVNI